MSPHRRSSRMAIQRVNNGMTFHKLTPKQTCLILALSHQSGWSADRIALSLMKTQMMTGISRIQAENIWSFFSNWVGKRHGNTILTSDEQTTMTAILEEAGLGLTATGNPLNMTVPPTTVIYNTTTWTPDDGSGLIPDFSLAMRTKNKKELMELPVTEDILLTYLSATELAIIKLFGEAVKVIFTSVMKRWGRAVRHNLRRPYDKLGVKALDKSKFVDLIMEYAAEYESSYETKFGKVEATQQQPVEGGKSPTLTVESTAFAGKILLALMMTDRFEVVNHLRKKRREEIQFTYIDVKDFPTMGDEVCTDCNVCYNPFDEEDCVPIQMVVCCFKLFCVDCMKVWLREKIINKGMRNVACPTCRQEFSDAFVEKLSPPEDREETVDEDGEDSGWEDERQIVEAEDTIVASVDQPEVAENSDVVMEDIVAAPEEPTSGEISADGGASNNATVDVREVPAEPTPEPIENVLSVNAMEDVQDLSQRVGEDVPAAASNMEGVQHESQPEGLVAEETSNRAVTPEMMANSELFPGEDAIPVHESFGSPFSGGVALMA